MSTPKTSFGVTLGRHDWNVALGGWHCEALRVPHTSIAEVFAAGKKLAADSWKEEQGVVRWIDTGARPAELRVILSIEAAPPTDSQSAELNAQAETARLRIEELKVKSERDVRFWQIMAGVIGVLLSAVTSIVTVVIKDRHCGDKGSTPEPARSTTTVVSPPPLTSTDAGVAQVPRPSPTLTNGITSPLPGVHEVEVGKVKAGNDSKIQVNNVEGEGKPNVSVNEVTAGDSATIQIGNKK